METETMFIRTKRITRHSKARDVPRATHGQAIIATSFSSVVHGWPDLRHSEYKTFTATIISLLDFATRAW